MIFKMEHIGKRISARDFHDLGLQMMQVSESEDVIEVINRIISLMGLLQCVHLDEDGVRCKNVSETSANLHLSDTYDLPRWVNVNLCLEHAQHYMV